MIVEKVNRELQVEKNMREEEFCERGGGGGQGSRRERE